MHRSILLVPILAALCAPNVVAQDWAKKMFETTRHDFGPVARGAKAEFKFKLKNGYVEDVHIARVRSSCSCTKVRVENPSLKSHETGAIVATINTQAFQGRKGATITVTFDKPYYAEVQLHDTVYIRGNIFIEPGSVSFGEFDQGQTVEKKVAVNHTGRSDWRVVDVRGDNPHVSGKVTNGRRNGSRITYDLIVSVDENVPDGYLREHLMLVTNDQHMKQVPVLVEGRVNSGITVTPAQLFLGVVRPGEKVQKQVVVRGKKPFRIVSIDSSDDSFKFDTTANTQSKSWHLVPVTFVGEEPEGKVTGTIHIQTDLDNSVLDLPAYATVTDEQ